ncbi:MAG TPA: aminoglycoside phosphotransferase family protein [Thermoflexia bacterium]|nr:aminoglycoside phosphotransferase family protein [Thermoflexia bacterium]
MKKILTQVSQQFQLHGTVQAIHPYGYGHINDTYLMKCNHTGAEHQDYILQRINHQVFTKPVELMRNIERVTAHLRRKIQARDGDVERETLNLVPTLDGEWFYQHSDGTYWRVYLFITAAQTYQQVASLAHVYNAAHAFGNFQELLSDFPAEELYETIPHFHHTRKRFEAFEAAVAADLLERVQYVRPEIEFIRAREAESSVLVDLIAEGKLPQRVTHNDTKFNNIMLDNETGQGICVIDLDTVMPGLSLYDFGDAVRFAANPVAEDTRDFSQVHIDLEIFDSLAHGYLDTLRETLTPLEIEYLPFSARLMTFENGIRFLTDYLQGDIYFKTHRENQNLDRCRVQLYLLADMERQFEQLTTIVAQYSNARG